MGLSEQGFINLTYILTSFILASVAGVAMWMGYRKRKYNRTTEEFVTARHQVGALRIGWAFFAGACGAWVMASPPYFGATYGVVGLAWYALASGLPLVAVAYAGGAISRKFPHVLSLTDFIRWRFGFWAQMYVALLVLFNMSIAMLAEYSTVGSFFGQYLDSTPVPIIVVVGVLTLAYTIYGGLLVSIFTDQIQGAAASLLFSITFFYVAATFRPAGGLPKPIPCDYAASGTCASGNFGLGWSQAFVMPASLFTATVFSEAIWQRAWASSSNRALRVGAALGCTGVTVIVFLSGFAGVLAVWGGVFGYVSPDFFSTSANSNLYFFQVINGGAPSEHISNWAGVLILILAALMNESAVDSFQNGFAAALSSSVPSAVAFFKGQKEFQLSILWTRVGVVFINVLLVVLGTQGYNVLQLFLLANMLCSTSALPVMSGLFSCLHDHIGGASMILSGLMAAVYTSAFGVSWFFGHYEEIRPCPCAPGVDEGCPQDLVCNPYEAYNYADDFSSGMRYTWLGNNYAWRFFLVPICTSIGMLFLCGAFNWGLQKALGRKPAVRGFTAPATHPTLFPDWRPDVLPVEEEEARRADDLAKGSERRGSSEEKLDERGREEREREGAHAALAHAALAK